MESLRPSARTGRRPGVRVGLGLISLLGYAALLIRHVDAVAGGADSSGYLNHARLLSEGRVHAAMRALPGLNPDHFSEFLYAPLGFVPHFGRLVPTYPAGLPLQIALVHWLVGWTHAADVVMVFSALAGVLLVYGLGRALGLGWRGAALAAAVLAASPLYLMFSVETMSDVPALTWTAAAALAAWLARSRPRWAYAAGAAFAVSVLIRPNNVLMLLPLAVAVWPARNGWRAALALAARFCLAGLPLAVLFCLHSRAAYGHAFTTGYGEAGTLFQAEVIPETLRDYAHWLPVVFTPAVWLVLLLPWAAGRNGRAVAFLGVWMATYLGFYVSYYHTHEAWWYLRFLLPAAPAFLLGTVWVLRALWIRIFGANGGSPGWRTAAVGLAAFVALRGEIKWNKEWLVLHSGNGETLYVDAMHWLNEHAAPGSVLVTMQTSGAAFYYTDFTVLRYDQIDAEHFGEVVRAAQAQHRAIYAPLFGFEFDEALKRRMPGLWRQEFTKRDVTVYRWEGGGQR